MPWYKIRDTTADFRTKLTDISGIVAAEAAVNFIQNNYPAPYHIMVSGGVDSQAMLYAWKLFGRDYIPTSVIYENDFNVHDLEEIKKFGIQHRIPINFIRFDLLDFYENNYWTLSEKFKSSSPQFAVHIAMTEKLNGTVIFAGNFLHYNGMAYSSIIHSLTLYAESRPCVPFFLSSHPDLAYTKLLYEQENNNENHFDTSDYQAKVKMYQDTGFPVIPQSEKFSGFEKIKDYFDVHYTHKVTLADKLTYCQRYRQTKRVYDILLRYPLEKKYGLVSYKNLVNEEFIKKHNVYVP